MWLALALLPHEWWAAIGAFALFRLLDIAKPGPIGWLDREVEGGLGVMLDDVVAGTLRWRCAVARNLRNPRVGLNCLPVTLRSARITDETRMNLLRLMAVITISLLTTAVLARPPVEVVALFKDSAVIRGVSGQELLRIGQTSKDGVRLIRADTRSATVGLSRSAV